MDGMFGYKYFLNSKVWSLSVTEFKYALIIAMQEHGKLISPSTYYRCLPPVYFSIVDTYVPYNLLPHLYSEY